MKRLILQTLIGSVIAIYFAGLILIMSQGIPQMAIVFIPSAGLLGKTLNDLTDSNHTSY